jgi:hypothetical protein
MTSAVLGLRGWHRALLPPVVAFIIANVVLAGVAAYGGHDPLRSATWESWDSPIYLEIAQYGYIVRECTPQESQQGATICGNLGWFPVYSWLIHAAMWLGFSPGTAGVLISLVLWLGLLTVMWNGLLVVSRGPAVLPALALAAFMPGAFYFHTVYPIALTVCALTVAAAFLQRRRWLAAGGAGFIAAAAYPAAGALALVAALWLAFFEPAPDWRERARRILLVSGLTVLGFAAILAFQQIDAGHWNGYFGVQGRFRHGIHLPFHNYWLLMKPQFTGLGHVSVFLALQEWLVTAIALGLLVSTWLRRRRGVADSFEWLLVLWALVFWIVPLCQNTVGYFRTDALLFPVAAGFVWMSTRVAWLYALAGLGVTCGMVLAFGQGILV